ncbi:hypothetical protein [Streptomyces sp. 1222.2]|uniref:hypothetical protein n=2 Tax=Streptomyces TaxID=1883 RepID=UPI00211C1BE5|nr:hypothetical protein [Streptomyces sp. 1222.2]
MSTDAKPAAPSTSPARRRRPGAGPSLMDVTMHALTVDAEVGDLRAADRLLHRLAAELALPEGTFGCTHLVRGDRPRVALSLAVPSEPLLSTVQERLAARDLKGAPGIPDAMGRAVIHPGVTALTGTLRIADVLDRSAISRVSVLGPPAGRRRTHRWSPATTYGLTGTRVNWSSPPCRPPVAPSSPSRSPNRHRAARATDTVPVPSRRGRGAGARTCGPFTRQVELCGPVSRSAGQPSPGAEDTSGR